MTKAGALFASYGALLALTSSCFVDNDSTFPGTIFLSNDAQLSTNDANYGTFNRAGATDACNDVFTETSGSCITDFVCGGTCSPFEASSCEVSRVQFVVPTTNPSVWPSLEPSGLETRTHDGPAQVEFDRTSLFGSDYWLRNVFVGLLVLLACGGAYMYCDKKARGQGEKTTNTEDESDDVDSNMEDGKEEEEEKREKGRRGLRAILNRGGKKNGAKQKDLGEAPEPYFPDDDVILDPHVSMRRRKTKKLSLFGFGKKKQKKEQQDTSKSDLDSVDDSHDTGYGLGQTALT
eukprot:CAMPEP_0116570342 /NCGR_PEP_ID=MMETSP0397-20121206/16881_1 /TAXON_ID=216820 /ORGANISM="Cyclophora tenuis, Strain ECT3854" /LENGTH=290 /DNA_ID=CAMNT_0004098177 /DNA_START=12 /DNA_END=884 /DNA_ORIENTATION=-